MNFATVQLSCVKFCLILTYSVSVFIVADIRHRSTLITKNWTGSTGRTSRLSTQCTGQTSLGLSRTRTRNAGTSTSWAPSSTVWAKTMASRLKGSTLHTCTLACGRPRLPGTRRTWTSTASTTSTLGPPRHGMPFHRSMGSDSRDWLKVSEVFKVNHFFTRYYLLIIMHTKEHS